MQTLGQVTVPVTTNWWSDFAGDTVKQVFLLLGIIGVVAVIVVLWVVFIRKPKTRERRKYPQYHEHTKTGPEVPVGETAAESDPDDDASEDEDSREAAGGKPSKHHGRRRRKETHRPRNPTLAETGGLPPLRDPGQPPPQ